MIRNPSEAGASRANRRRKARAFSCGLLAASALTASACSSRQPKPETTGAASEELTPTSCQALEIAIKKDAKEFGATTYAINASGQVYGWGANKAPYYPLGSAAFGDQVKSPAFLGVNSAVHLAAGRYGACAVINASATSGTTDDGAVVCWGLQPGGLFPPATGQEQATLVTSDATGEPLVGVTAITYGDKHACALRNDTTVWCWGDDTYGQLGDATEGGPAQPGLATTQATRMLNVVGVTAIAAAGSTTCILRTLPSGAREVECLGDNQFGQLGQGSSGESTFEPIPTPIRFTGDSPNFATLYGGGKGTFCASTEKVGGAQTTFCWGANDHAQAAITNHLATPGPLPISADVGATWAQGDLNGCEANASGAVTCWGANSFGEIPGAGGPEVNVSTPVAGIAKAFVVSVGETHACALMTDALACWGRNANGEIGNGTTGDTTPVTKVSLSVPVVTCGTGKVGESCGVITNTCGTTTCGGCAAPATCDATTHTCKACVPNPLSTTCFGKQCGTAVNNCGETVTCPNNCVAPKTCGGGGAGPNACGCTPQPLATTCAGKQCGTTVNNCGQTVTCPNTCTGSKTCGGGGAGPNWCGCTPTGDACGTKCSGTAIDSCGQVVQCSSDCDVCDCGVGYCNASTHRCACRGPRICP